MGEYKKQARRGASGLAYALVLGLASLASLSAVTVMGESVATLFRGVADEIDPGARADRGNGPDPCTQNGQQNCIAAGSYYAGEAQSVGSISQMETEQRFPAGYYTGFTVPAMTVCTTNGQTNCLLTGEDSATIAPDPGAWDVTDGARSWGDGSYPTSCKGYLTDQAPGDNASVSGNNPADSMPYVIRTNGVVRTVWCDMAHEGGGWTLAYAFQRNGTSASIQSGASGKFPGNGDFATLTRTDGVGWAASHLSSSQDWIITVIEESDDTMSVSRTETANVGWVLMYNRLGLNFVLTEYANGDQYTESNWTDWESGYNSGEGTSNARCNNHVWWLDYSGNLLYMPQRDGTGCIHESNKTLLFWVRED